MLLLVVTGTVNFSEAIELLEAVSDFHFKSSEEPPDFCIYDNQNQGYSLRVKAKSVSEEYRYYLNDIVESRKLRIRESDGYIVIHGP
jgi:hypothetical protein